MNTSLGSGRLAASMGWLNRAGPRNRYLHAYWSNVRPEVRVSLEISMNKVTSVTLNFHTPLRERETGDVRLPSRAASHPC